MLSLSIYYGNNKDHQATPFTGLRTKRQGTQIATRNTPIWNKENHSSQSGQLSHGSHCPESLECPSLEIFKTYLDVALRNMFLFRSSPALSRKLEQIISRGLLQPRLFLILWKWKQALQVRVQVISNHRDYNTSKITQKFPKTIKTHKAKTSY